VPGRLVALNAEVDRLYNQGTSALTNRQFREAVSNLEQLQARQNQANFSKYQDVSSLLLRAYLQLGDQLWQSAQYKDFQEGLGYLKKASQLAKTLDASDRNQQEEITLQTRVDNGLLYEQAVTAYNRQQWETAVTGFGPLYAKDQNFRNASSLFYDALVKLGDARLAANQLPEAYQNYARAASLKNVADTRYAQARANTVGNQLRQSGIPVPTITVP
jgi:outer membrane protein assembly factor BamD (BamD/ComL family)